MEKSAAFDAGVADAMTKLAFHTALVKEAADAEACDQSLVWMSDNGAFVVDVDGQFWQLDMEKDASIRSAWEAGKRGLSRAAGSLKTKAYQAAPAISEAAHAANRAAHMGPGHAAGAGAAKLLERGAHALKGGKHKAMHGLGIAAEMAGAMAH